MLKSWLPLLSFALVSAQTPTIEQSLSMRTASSPRISPDGRFIAYQVSEANWDENDFVPQIWIAVTATGERYQLTRGKKSSGSVDWSPDGWRLAFSERDGKRQIYVVSPTGGEPVQLTAVDSGVSDFRWSPDRASIGYTSAGPEDKARKEQKDKYGDFEIVKGDYTMSYLWVIQVPAEINEKPKPEQLTQGASFNRQPVLLVA